MIQTSTKNNKRAGKTFKERSRLQSVICLLFCLFNYSLNQSSVSVEIQPGSPRKLVFLSNFPKNEYENQNQLKSKINSNYFKGNEKKIDSYFVAGIALEPTIIMPYYGVEMKLYLRKLKKPINKQFDIISSMIYDTSLGGQEKLENIEEKEIEYIEDKLNINNDPKNLNFVGGLTNLQIMESKYSLIGFGKDTNRYTLTYKDFYENGISLEFNHNGKESIQFYLSFSSDLKVNYINNLIEFKDFELEMDYDGSNLKLEQFIISRTLQDILLESMEEDEGTNFVIKENEQTLDEDDPFGTNKYLEDLIKKLENGELVDSEDGMLESGNNEYGNFNSKSGRKRDKNETRNSSGNKDQGNDGKNSHDDDDDKNPIWGFLFRKVIFLLIGLIILLLIRRYYLKSSKVAF